MTDSDLIADAVQEREAICLADGITGAALAEAVAATVADEAAR